MARAEREWATVSLTVVQKELLIALQDSESHVRRPKYVVLAAPGEEQPDMYLPVADRVCGVSLETEKGQMFVQKAF